MPKLCDIAFKFIRGCLEPLKIVQVFCKAVNGSLDTINIGLSRKGGICRTCIFCEIVIALLECIHTSSTSKEIGEQLHVNVQHQERILLLDNVFLPFLCREQTDYGNGCEYGNENTHCAKRAKDYSCFGTVQLDFLEFLFVFIAKGKKILILRCLSFSFIAFLSYTTMCPINRPMMAIPRIIAIFIIQRNSDTFHIFYQFSNPSK